VGCDVAEPTRLRQVAPDLSGLSLNGLRGIEIVEVLVDAGGDVQDVCLLRGVREDIDGRTVAAVRQWRFTPARLRHSTPPGLPVSIVMSVSVPIGG
jgi:outer membrane biosynthesis protein TonB